MLDAVAISLFFWIDLSVYSFLLAYSFLFIFFPVL
ncbi:hypothetical protein M6B38_128840 [Iris pallida]|uniref:Uncharacterized protein n=1 Tax=Iris pallida TaxID=29817 RepID=A0AAX6G519_IRIPA|nr:hypothetical protein M6B38_128840 [Iris pallida]